MDGLSLISHSWSLSRFLAQASFFWLLVILAGSLVVLIKGAGWAIDGAVSLASRLNLPRIVIGATILSLGTTMPEMFVSVMAAWMGQSGLALGNGVGSIICDTGLIFGLTSTFTVIPMNRYILDRTGWVQVGSATLLVVISLIALALSNGQPVLGRPVGILFLILLAGYLYVSYVWAVRSNGGRLESALELAVTSPVVAVGHMIVGLTAVVLASRVLVLCAAEWAYRVGVPEDIVAATLVAFGTSVPELITAITAVRKGHPEIMLGNVVGADVLNCLFVIGAAAVASPLSVPPTFYTFHFPAMLAILYSFRFFIFHNRDGRFKRWQGAWVLSLYLLYLVLQYAFNLGTVH